MVFVSMGFRLRIEVEALNMVEALGGYTRHRTVSVLRRVSKDGNTWYRVLVVPAISGQSIAHGYHRVIVDLANLMNLPVCDECKLYERRGGFTKRTASNDRHDDRIKTCVVEDLTGFLAPDAKVRRTSPVSFSYLVPDVESARAIIDSQFHVRYNFETMDHNPFTIESGTAIYTLSIAVDIDRIGRYENGGYVSDRDKRIELALKSIAALLEGFTFGAKKARYLPIEEVVGGIAAISTPIPFMVSPPRVYRDGRNYISETVKRAQKYVEVLKDVNEEIKIYYMDREGVVSEHLESIERVETVSEMISKVLSHIMSPSKPG